ncbi:MAG TPA: ATP-binding protein, partial [Bacteroidetes bacterium]|nr:ATP-binding protein [Bacteroidota bacterium]
MARMLNLPPSAASLTTSLRDLGYSLETAVADLIDNCISADATDVKIIFDMSGTSPVFVIIDNGRGMNEDQLIEAMRHGTTDPRKIRTRNDLGRFGLGLKTASFSQCRWLTVVTSVNGIRAAAEWNLENVERDNAWNVAVLDSEEISSQPYINELPNSGTLVIWRDLDRLFEHETGDKREKIVYEKISNVTRHLALVFHRFLA